MPKYTTTNHQIFLNDGSLSAPGITFSAESTLGIYRLATQFLVFVESTSVQNLGISNRQLILPSTATLNWAASTAVDDTLDTRLGRRAAAVPVTNLGGSTYSAATNSVTLGGVATINTTAVGNVGAGTDDLMTYSLPANALSANGKGIRITAWGTTANNANAKTVTLEWGDAATVLTTALTASIVGQWRITATVIRTGASTQDVSAMLVQGATVIVDQEQTAATQTDTAAIQIAVTGTATANNDIVQEGLLVEFFN